MSSVLRTIQRKLSVVITWLWGGDISKRSAPSKVEVYLIFGLGCIIGGIMFLALYGTKVLDTSYIEWFTSRSGDPAAHYAGWLYYRYSPWTFPIGKTLNYLFPFGTSPTYTDSIPLFAIPLKLISAFLPSKFQYFGIWGMFSFVMQGGFAALLLRKFINNNLICGICTYFFVYSEPLMLKMFGHTALGGQFIILAALCLWVYGDRFKSQHVLALAWGGCCSASILIHPYFIVMTGTLLTGYLIKDFIEYQTTGEKEKKNERVHSKARKIPTRMTISKSIRMNPLRQIELFLVPTVMTSFFFWQAGGFENLSKGLVNGLLGEASLNLNALINPWSTSAFIKGLPVAPIYFSGEGRQYLGMGVLMLVLLWVGLNLWNIKNLKSVILKTRCMRTKLFYKYLPYFFSTLVLLILALSPKVYLNDHLLLEYKVPQLIGKVWGIFQSSGRLFWPVFYGVMALIIIRTSNKIKSKKKLLLIMLCAVSIQYFDMKPLLTQVNQRFTKDLPYGDGTELKSPFWDSALEKFTHAEFIYTYDIAQPLRLALKGAQHGLVMNAGYSARLPMDKMAKRAEKNLNGILAGDMDSRTMYIMQDRYALFRVMDKLDSDKYSLYNVEGYLVLFKNKILETKSWTNANEIKITVEALGPYIENLKAKNENDLVCISTYLDGFKGMKKADIDSLKSLGLSLDITGKEEQSYLAAVALQKRKAVSELISEGLLEQSFHGDIMSGLDLAQNKLQIVSRGNSVDPGEYNWFDAASKIDGEAIWPNTSGVNIIIYDLNTNVVKQVAWFSATTGHVGKILDFPYEGHAKQ